MTEEKLNYGEPVRSKFNDVGKLEADSRVSGVIPNDKQQ